MALLFFFTASMHHGHDSTDSQTQNQNQHKGPEIRYVLYIRFDRNDRGASACYEVAKHMTSFIVIEDLLDLLERNAVPPYIKGSPSLVDRQSPRSPRNPMTGRAVYDFLVEMKKKLGALLTSSQLNQDGEGVVFASAPRADLTELRNRKKKFSDDKKLDGHELTQKINSYLSYHDNYTNDVPAIEKKKTAAADDDDMDIDAEGYSFYDPSSAAKHF